MRNLFSWLLGLGGCLVVLGASATAEVVDRIVAVVNDEVIALSELNAELAPYLEKIQTMGYDPEQAKEMGFKVRDQLLNQLIDQKLTAQAVKKASIRVEDSEVDATLERMKEARMLTDEDLRAGLAAEGMTIEQYRQRIKDEILRSRLLNLEIKSKVVITSEEVETYYREHAEQYGGEKAYQLHTILMRVPDFSTDIEKAAVFKRMQRIMGELDSGADFIDLAKQYSEFGPADGGELGVFEAQSLSPTIAKAIQDLAAGQYSTIVDTDQGYQIFFVRDIVRQSGKTLDEARPEIEEILFRRLVDEKFESWISDLRERSHIKIIK